MIIEQCWINVDAFRGFVLGIGFDYMKIIRLLIEKGGKPKVLIFDRVGNMTIVTVMI